MIKLETTTAYDVKEAAEMLHRSKNTIRSYIKSGELKAQKVGNTWYITDKTLTEFITGEKPEKR
jgi:excisionase family DNA binding protein